MDIQPLAEARKKIRGPSAPQTPVGMTQKKALTGSFGCAQGFGWWKQSYREAL
jgi:hypothetical protein